MNPESQTGNESHTCDRCGQFDAMEIAGKFLCADCISLAGCACVGHGDDSAE